MVPNPVSLQHLPCAGPQAAAIVSLESYWGVSQVGWDIVGLVFRWIMLPQSLDCVQGVLGAFNLRLEMTAPAL
jgi:hypothetical protein